MDISTKKDHFVQISSEFTQRRISLNGPCEFVIERCYFFLKKKEMNAAYEAARKEMILLGKDPDDIDKSNYDPLLVMPNVWQCKDKLKKLGNLEGANPYEYMLRFEGINNRVEKGWVTWLSERRYSQGYPEMGNCRGDRIIEVDFVNDDNGVIATNVRIDYSTPLRRGSCDEFRCN